MLVVLAIVAIILIIVFLPEIIALLAATGITHVVGAMSLVVSSLSGATRVMAERSARFVWTCGP